MDLVLVPLQPDQPPARASHAHHRQRRPQNHPQNRVAPASARDDHAQSARGEDHEQNGQPEVQGPGMVLEMAAEDWEEAEDFDAEKCEGKDVCCRGQARSEHCACHERGIGGERCRKSE